MRIFSDFFPSHELSNFSTVTVQPRLGLVLSWTQTNLLDLEWTICHLSCKCAGLLFGVADDLKFAKLPSVQVRDDEKGEDEKSFCRFLLPVFGASICGSQMTMD